MPLVGFERMIPVFVWGKKFVVLYGEPTAIGMAESAGVKLLYSEYIMKLAQRNYIVVLDFKLPQNDLLMNLENQIISKEEYASSVLERRQKSQCAVHR